MSGDFMIPLRQEAKAVLPLEFKSSFCCRFCNQDDAMSLDGAGNFLAASRTAFPQKHFCLSPFKKLLCFPTLRLFHLIHPFVPCLLPLSDILLDNVARYIVLFYCTGISASGDMFTFRPVEVLVLCINVFIHLLSKMLLRM